MRIWLWSICRARSWRRGWARSAIRPAMAARSCWWSVAGAWAREIAAEAMLDRVAGLAGDNWLGCGSTGTPDGSADPQRQVTVMNVRVAALVAGGMDRVPLAGDQLYVDLDLSVGNLPAGSLLAVGQAVLQVSELPYLGCAKFVERFGAEAMRFVNSRAGRQLRLRGMNTRVVEPVSSARVTLPPRPAPLTANPIPGTAGKPRA